MTGCGVGTPVTVAEETEPQNDVIVLRSRGRNPRRVRPLELPAYVWLLVRQYSYRHEAMWTASDRYGRCGQSCPCRRFAVGDFFGACEVGSGVRTLASVSAAVRIAFTPSIDLRADKSNFA